METRKHVLAGILCAFLASVFAGQAEGKAVYAITDHHNNVLKTYDIQGDSIEYLANITVNNYGSGAADITLDGALDKLYITYEGPAKIVWADPGFLIQEGVLDLSTAPISAQPLAGVVASDVTHRVYAIERDGNKLYTCWWDNTNEELILMDPNDPSQPYDPSGPNYPYAELAGLNSPNGAWGLALDESTAGGENGRLYVSNDTNNVNYYDMGNWTLIGTRDVGRDVADLAIDPNNDVHPSYLYTGALYDGYNNFGHNYLIKHNLEAAPGSPNRNIEDDIGTVPIGVAVDPESSLVYTTTSNRRVCVYDCSDPCFICTDWEPASGSTGPAGITVGSNYKVPWKVYLNKDDGLDPCDPCSPSCYSPGDEFVYTITYGPDGYDHEWVEVTDILPREVTFISSTPQYNEYNSDENSYFWSLGSLAASDPCGYITINVQVNEMADPNGIIINTAIIETDLAYKVITIETLICCWEDPCAVSGVIYVNGMLDPTSTYNTGTSWENAYLDLQSALRRAGVCGAEIWVAMDTYSPGDEPTDSFVIPDTVEVYGGFIGDETSREQRDFVAHKTYLTGYIDGVDDNEKVVTMGDNTILDGFIVQNGYDGVYSDENNNSFTIANCIINDNMNYGIDCQNSNAIIDRCVIKENGYDGIYSSGSGKTVEVNNCRIYGNDENGIYCHNSTPTVINSMIHHNGSDGAGYYGIKLYEPSDNPDIRNNTIVYNQNEGIYFTGDNEPDINNCILWYNDKDNDFEQMGNCSAEYSCITDPNDLYGLLPGASTPDQYGNISCDPCFAYSDPDLGNFHLDPDSECIDKGDNSVVDPNGFGEHDIDGDDRVLDGNDDAVAVVDMGADEVACEDVSHPYDLNGDGIINLHEFADLSRAWLLDDNDPNWADTYIKCDFNADGQIDILDLRAFAEVWLWQACYRLNGVSIMMMMGSDGMDKTMSAPAIAKMPTKAEVERGRIAKWRRNRQPSLQEQMDQISDILYWAENFFVENPELEKEIDEELWKDFLNKLYEMEADLLKQWKDR